MAAGCGAPLRSLVPPCHCHCHRPECPSPASSGTGSLTVPAVDVLHVVTLAQVLHHRAQILLAPLQAYSTDSAFLLAAWTAPATGSMTSQPTNPAPALQPACACPSAANRRHPPTHRGDILCCGVGGAELGIGLDVSQPAGAEAAHRRRAGQKWWLNASRRVGDCKERGVEDGTAVQQYTI